MFNSVDFEKQIGALLRARNNVILVGPSDCGKTWFVERELVPYLQQQALKLIYYKNCDAVLGSMIGADAVVVDEVESLQDKDYLETLHPNESPYYSNEYLTKIARWDKTLSAISLPGVYIVSREKKAIPYFIEHVHSLDWNGKPADVIEFTRESRVG